MKHRVIYCINRTAYHVSRSCDVAGCVHWLGDVGTDVKLDNEISRVCIVCRRDDVIRCTVGCHVDDIACTPAQRLKNSMDNMA